MTGKKNPWDRMKNHALYAPVSVAVIPVEGAEVEKSIGNLFHKIKEDGPGADSLFSYREIGPYAEELVQRCLATSDPEKACQLSRAPFSSWSPEALSRPPTNGALFYFGSESNIRDTWQTPELPARVVRAGLGGEIDLDPASDYLANRIIGAKFIYNKDANGLNFPWEGAVFLNPPYGLSRENRAYIFMRHLVKQFDLGNTTKAIALLNLDSASQRWFREIRQRSCMSAIWNGRIKFIGPAGKDGKAPTESSPRNGSIFLYFGKDDGSTFAKAFSPHAWVQRTL